jgi:hypothetical protein
MAGLMFMDCGGYRSLETIRTWLESEGRKLEVINQRGGPARLLALLAEPRLTEPVTVSVVSGGLRTAAHVNEVVA